MKVLIIRSGPLALFERALKVVVAEDEEAEISALTHVSTNEEMLALQPLKLHNYSSRRINLLSVNWKTLLNLRRNQYDRIIILYTNVLGQGYGAIRLLAFFLNPKQVQAFNLKGKMVELNFIKSSFQYFVEKISFVFYGIIWIALFLKKRLVYANRN